MRRAIFHCLLRISKFHKPINQPRRKRIASAHTIINLQPRPRHRLMQLALIPTNRAPIIHRRALHGPQCRRHRLEIRIRRDRLLNHLPKALNRQLRHVRIHAFNFNPERRGKIFLIANHHIDVLSNLAIHLLRPRLPTNRLPQTRAIIQIVARHRPILLRGLQRLNCNLGRRLRKRGKNSARMKPPHAFLPKNLIPINLAWLHLTNRRQPTVRTTPRPAAPKSTLHKIEPIADRPPNPIKRHPLHMAHIHPALQHEIFHEPSNRIIRKRRHRRRPQPKTTPQPTHHIIFAAAFPHTKFPRRMNTTIPGIKPQHDLAQTRRIPLAVRGTLQIQLVRHLLYYLSEGPLEPSNLFYLTPYIIPYFRRTFNPQLLKICRAHFRGQPNPQHIKKKEAPSSDTSSTIKDEYENLLSRYLVAKAGIEPATHGFSVRCSTN